LQSYVAQLLPANSSDPATLSMATLQEASLVQINSSAAVLAFAKGAGFDNINAFMPGLQMFWNDVSGISAHAFPAAVLAVAWCSDVEPTSTHNHCRLPPLDPCFTDDQRAGELLHVSLQMTVQHQQASSACGQLRTSHMAHFKARPCCF
jgi:hypothetical protein